MNVLFYGSLFSALIAGILTAPLIGNYQAVPSVNDSGVNSTDDDGDFVGVDPNLIGALVKIDEQSEAITHFRASFTQDKKTPLLRKPMRSSGILLAQGPQMRWNTAEPHTSVMLIDQRPGHNEISFYYADDALLEIHPLNHHLGQLAGFPLPHFRELARQFVIEHDNTPLTDSRGSGLGLQLSPKDETTQQHIQKIRLLIDRENGLVWKVEITDEDGGQTLLTFRDLDTHTPVTNDELELKVPIGTEVIRTSQSATVEATSD